MAKLIYDNSAMKHDTPDNSLQHWKYIKRVRVGDKWKYFYKDDEKDKGSSTTTNVKKTDRQLVAEKMKQDAVKAAYKKSVELRSQSSQDKRKAIGGGKLESERTAHEVKLNKASQEARTKVGKQILDKASTKDKKAEREAAVAKGKEIKEQAMKKASEAAKKEAAKKEAAAEKQKQHEADVIKSMTDRKNAKLNEKKAVYDEAKAKKDAEVDAVRKAAKEKATEFAKKFLENRKTEAERKREEEKRKRKR